MVVVVAELWVVECEAGQRGLKPRSRCSHR